MRMPKQPGPFTLGPAALLLCGAAANAAAYTADFEGGTVGAEWTSLTPGLTLAIDAAPNGQHFLGALDNSNLGLPESGVQLRLGGASGYSGFNISFDLYAIGAWHGNAFAPVPSFFAATFNNGATSLALINTTFSNDAAVSQSYSANFYVANPAFTGSSAQNTLGYAVDTTYSLGTAWGFAASTNDLVFTFFAAGLGPLANASWGIDNVVVNLTTDDGGGGGTVPLPAAVWLFGTALGAIALHRRPQA